MSDLREALEEAAYLVLSWPYTVDLRATLAARIQRIANGAAALASQPSDLKAKLESLRDCVGRIPFSVLQLYLMPKEQETVRAILEGKD